MNWGRWLFPLALGCLLLPQAGFPQGKQVVWSADEQPLYDQLKSLRSVPDDQRGEVTRKLAAGIGKLPKTLNKLRLAEGLAGRSTEGDFGHESLEAVAVTLAAALREQPVPDEAGKPAAPYRELASLIRYEKVTAGADLPQVQVAMKDFEREDKERQTADFTLTDLHGKPWTLRALHDKVVLVNFWATWCPPCRKEMPDLDKLYTRFREKGLVILAISDEERAKVEPYLREHSVSYPVLLDPGRKVNELFRVEGIPKSFVYDRTGKLVAQSIDMRTEKQFLGMLAAAGLR